MIILPANTLPSSKCSLVVCGDDRCCCSTTSVGLKFITVMMMIRGVYERNLRKVSFTIGLFCMYTIVYLQVYYIRCTCVGIL